MQKYLDCFTENKYSNKKNLSRICFGKLEQTKTRKTELRSALQIRLVKHDEHIKHSTA